jgi:hypothetical protein
MAWYLTAYRAMGTPPKRPPRRSVGAYGSYIWANSHRQARARARRRGIGEWLDLNAAGRPRTLNGRRPPYMLPSEMLRKRWSWTPKRRLELIHATTFLAFLLSNCRRGRTRLQHHQMLLGDEGLLHQVAHCMSLGTPRRRDLARTVANFERLVPGYTGAS